MDFLQLILPCQDVIESVIKMAIEDYKSSKEFFEMETEGREYWNAYEICGFMSKLGVRIAPEDVLSVVKKWTGDKIRDSIK